MPQEKEKEPASTGSSFRLLLGQLNNFPNNNRFKAVLLAPYGATAKHGTYYDRKFTFFKWDTMIYLPE